MPDLRGAGDPGSRADMSLLQAIDMSELRMHGHVRLWRRRLLLGRSRSLQCLRSAGQGAKMHEMFGTFRTRRKRGPVPDLQFAAGTGE